MKGSSGSVTVDRGFVRVDGKSYAVDKITSIEVRSDSPPANKNANTWLGLAGLIAIVAVSAPPLFLAAALPAYIAYRSYKNPPLPTHRLMLMMASTEAAALTSTDLGEIEALRDRIEEEMRSEPRR